jgi:hypothetical protein
VGRGEDVEADRAAGVDGFGALVWPEGVDGHRGSVERAEALDSRMNLGFGLGFSCVSYQKP